MAQLQELPPAPPCPGADRSSGSFWLRLTRGVRRLYGRADWDELAGADWPERILSMPATDHFHAKQGRSTGRLLLKQGERRLGVYLKRHYRLPWWRGWLATLWPGGDWSPALHERANLLHAAAHGLPVPKVVAAGEWIGPRGALQSFLAIEELTGMLPLHEAIPLAQSRLPPSRFCRWKRGLAAEMVRLVQLLHQRRWYHKDLYLCHFYVPETDTDHVPTNWLDRVHVIDLHRLQHHPWTWPIWLLKDLGGLLYSSLNDGVTPRDRWLFWRMYCDGQHQTWRQRFWAWCVRLKGANYRRHNEKRQRTATPLPSVQSMGDAGRRTRKGRAA